MPGKSALPGPVDALKAHEQVREFLELLDQQRHAFDTSRALFPVNETEYKRLDRESRGSRSFTGLSVIVTVRRQAEIEVQD